MVVEFYMEGREAPKDFDAFVDGTGGYAYVDGRKLSKLAVIRVLVDKQAYQEKRAKTLCGMMKVVMHNNLATVAFYGFEPILHGYPEPSS